MEQKEIQALVERSRKQDASAFALLVAEYQTFVFRLAFRLLCNEEEARDMVQETFLRVWLSLDKYRPEFPILRFPSCPFFPMITSKQC